MPIEVIVTPICTAEMYSLMFASCSSASSAPLRAFVAHHFQARAARAHERVLGDHEERVDRDQHGREDELQAVHAAARIRRAPARPAKPCRLSRVRAYGQSRPRYFGEVLRRRSSLADAPNGSKASRRKQRIRGRALGSAQASASICVGEREVGVGEAALGVGRERQAHLVPAVHQDVGVVVGRLRELGDAIDEARSRRRSPRTSARARSTRPSRRHSPPCEALLDLVRR